jgi:hypothetical protein
MFDINTIIAQALAAAINEAVLPLAARISDLEEANTILTNRLNEETVRLALNHDKLVERVSEVRMRTDEARALSLALAERQPAETPVPPVLSEDDYFRRDALVGAFIEKLNSQEWFWDKINAHIEGTIERLDVDNVTTDTFPEMFATQWQRKVGANDLLGRDEVAEIVRELWSEEFEPEVRDVAERVTDDYDFDDKIRRAVRDYDFSEEIEQVICDYDFSDKLESAIDDYDLDSKIENGIDSYDFDFESKVRDVLRNARIDISI